MSLSSAVLDLATRVGQEVKAVRAELTSGLSGKAADSDVVKVTGAQSVGGVKTFTSGVKLPEPSVPESGVRNDDTRLSNARTPSAHASTHAPGGSDVLTPAALGAARRLTPTSVKTSAYTAQVGELVLCDDSAGSFTVALPACATGAEVAVKKVVSSGNTVTIGRAGSDTIGGALATSVTLKLVDQTTTFLGNATNWLPVHNWLGLPSLDSRYVQTSAAAVTADQAANVASIRTLGTGALQATAGNDSRLSDERDSPAAKANAANGWLKLDGSALVPQNLLPAIAMVDYLGTVASQAAMLALTGQRGDWCYRSDLGTDWQLIAEPSTSLASWQERHYPSSPVSSVNGRTGTVTGLAEASALAGYQPIDQDLTDISGLTPTNGDFLRRVAGAWSNVTTAALKTALALVKADVGLDQVDNTSNATERAATRTLTNARITKRIGTTASSTTPTADADNHDQYNVTALAAGATFGAPTGTPTDGQMLLYRIKDNGTARTLAWNAIFRAVGVTLPTTTVLSKTLYVGTIYNAADSKWDVTATGQEA